MNKKLLKRRVGELTFVVNEIIGGQELTTGEHLVTYIRAREPFMDSNIMMVWPSDAPTPVPNINDAIVCEVFVYESVVDKQYPAESDVPAVKESGPLAELLATDIPLDSEEEIEECDWPVTCSCFSCQGELVEGESTVAEEKSDDLTESTFDHSAGLWAEGTDAPEGGSFSVGVYPEKKPYTKPELKEILSPAVGEEMPQVTHMSDGTNTIPVKMFTTDYEYAEPASASWIDWDGVRWWPVDPNREPLVENE